MISHNTTEGLYLHLTVQCHTIVEYLQDCDPFSLWFICLASSHPHVHSLSLSHTHTHTHTQTFPTNTPLTHKGLLQLWSVGQLSNIPAETDPLPRPRLELGVAHEWGCVRALRWCPSGCWETKGEQVKQTLWMRMRSS